MKILFPFCDEKIYCSPEKSRFPRYHSIGLHQAPFPYTHPGVWLTIFLAVCLCNQANSSPYTLQQWRIIYYLNPDDQNLCNFFLLKKIIKYGNI
jgi:hypothetical protein